MKIGVVGVVHRAPHATTFPFCHVRASVRCFPSTGTHSFFALLRLFLSRFSILIIISMRLLREYRFMSMNIYWAVVVFVFPQLPNV
uniref:Uncharacterized protein LOC105108231 isoform X5 n=1 Tax=Rhizophora mucronata TaxID=61149 RepID=A0A2P2LFQ4_RHIMU